MFTRDLLCNEFLQQVTVGQNLTFRYEWTPDLMNAAARQMAGIIEEIVNRS